MGFGLFKRMRDLGLYQFDKATLTTILSACEGPEYCYVSKMVHGLVIYNGFLLRGRYGFISAFVSSYIYFWLSSSLAYPRRHLLFVRISPNLQLCSQILGVEKDMVVNLVEWCEGVYNM